MLNKCGSSGPANADVLVVGEAPGAEEEIQGIPFVGESGKELTRMLAETGWNRDAMRLTNVCRYRPPQNDIGNFFLDDKRKHPNELILEGIRDLKSEIEAVKPKLILALGDTPFWALTGRHGITKWRGSMLTYGSAALLPTFHPAGIMREWSNRAIACRDLRRGQSALPSGWHVPVRAFQIRPTFEQVLENLRELRSNADSSPVPYRLASDIETRAGHIACHGLAWARHEALSIPFMCVERPRGYWSTDEELAIWESLRATLQHPNIEVVGQNYHYDAQYIARRCGYVPRVRHDTMIMQNVMWPGTPRGLDFLSSMYRQHHVYWKDEGKEWNPKTQPEEQLWTYNCEDAIATYEIAETMLPMLQSDPKLWAAYKFQMDLWHSTLRVMLRGVRVDQKRKGELALELFSAISQRESELEHMAGEPLNIRSAPQVHAFFYDKLKLPVIRDRKTKRPTCNDEALERFMEREPLLRRFIGTMQDLRSLGVFLSTFVQAPLDPDGRMRTSFGLAETFRFTSSKSAFYTGANMQNLPKGDEDDKTVAESDKLLPNIRKLFIPEPGYTIAEIDQSGADAQVVAWDSGDEELKQVFRRGLKLHRVNARMLFGDRAGPSGDLEPYYTYAKVGAHLSNYGGGAPILAAKLHISLREAEDFQRRWFGLHPAIVAWHDAIEHSLQSTRQVSNRFGYRRFYFDRVAGLLPEALAWVPQSTVALVTAKGFHNLECGNFTEQALLAEMYKNSITEEIYAQSRRLRDLGFELLLQVHDSILFQYPTSNANNILPIVKQLTQIPIPYDDPLVIPWGLKASTVSWGDCKELVWP